MRYQFIEQHRGQFPISRLCQVLGVSRSGYYRWRKRPASARQMANQRLVEQIKRVHTASQARYGSPRIYHDLKAQGVACSRNRVARLMQRYQIRAHGARRYKGTTKRDPAHSVHPNRLAQQFTAGRPNQIWLSDISYIRTREGWLYLAAILDLYSRRIVGWAMRDQMTSALVEEALHMALGQRRPPPGLLHHSDRGSQYTGQPYQSLLQAHQFQVSMSATGNCYDNAPMESFFASLKRELVYQRTYHTRAEARLDIFCYIETFYNRQRRHSALDYLSPIAFEERPRSSSP